MPRATRASRGPRGRYVAFLDSDNEWTPDYLATMVAARKKTRLACGAPRRSS